MTSQSCLYYCTFSERLAIFIGGRAVNSDFDLTEIYDVEEGFTAQLSPMPTARYTCSSLYGYHCDLKLSSSQAKNYENFANYFFKTKANNKCF